jgi:hypothetical protein
MERQQERMKPREIKELMETPQERAEFSARLGTSGLGLLPQAGV